MARAGSPDRVRLGCRSSISRDRRFQKLNFVAPHVGRSGETFGPSGMAIVTAVGQNRNKERGEAMSAVKKLLVTEAEYLARENASPLKSEFYQGEIFAMTGASPKHNQIKENLVVEIGGKLKGGKCRTRSSDQRLKVQETNYICYPDVLIVCDEPEYDESDKYALVNPSVIIEVLSPSNQRHDRIFKYRQFQQIPSLKEYVLVHQTHMVIERFSRTAEAGWRHQIFMGKSADFVLESVSLAIPMADVFAGIDIPEQVEDVAGDD